MENTPIIPEGADISQQPNNMGGVETDDNVQEPSDLETPSPYLYTPPAGTYGTSVG
jgi:hypothetical protein